MDPAPATSFSLGTTLQQFVGTFIQTTLSVVVMVGTWLILQGRRGGALSMMNEMGREMDTRYPSLAAFNATGDETRRRLTELDIRIADQGRDMRELGNQVGDVKISIARIESSIAMLPLKIGSQVQDAISAQMVASIAKLIDDNKKPRGGGGLRNGDA